HSLGFRIIRENYARLSLQEDIRLIGSERFNLKDTLLEDAAQLAGQARASGAAAKEYRDHGCREGPTPEVHAVCERYREILQACNAIDHDDQIVLACDLLESDASILASWKSKAQHLLIDEYQDINAAQFRLIKLLTNGQENGLFVVGDDDQSIYGFRGGSPEYVRRFKDHFGQSAMVEVMDYYRRCPQRIQEGAFDVVRRFDASRLEKPNPRYAKQGDTRIVLHDVPSQEVEASIIGRIAATAIRSLPPKGVLVLVPRIAFAEPIKRALRQRGLRYDCRADTRHTGLPFFQLLSEWIASEQDNLALRECIQRIIDSGGVGVPTKRARSQQRIAERERVLSEVSVLWTCIIQERISLNEALFRGAQRSETLRAITEVLTAFREAHARTAGDFLKEVADKCRLWSGVEALLKEIGMWIEEGTNRGGFAAETVRIMTIQSAKGLEEDVVCVVGFDDGVFPRAGATDAALIEESRLCYVSITRASGELHLFHARTRDAAITFLQPDRAQGYRLLRRSPFLDAISEANVETRYVQSQTGNRRQSRCTASTVRK
ncbi:MAG: ATP-dependent helicase, partial [Candidatus Omnitrophica bacterium]|nr:ATP-dependent helicase [Candidatus Omnitrophota bacterium]